MRPRALVPADEPAFVDLYRRSGAVPPPGARLGWKYGRPDSGRWVVDKGLGLVGHTGFAAFPIEVEGAPALGGTFGDVFTDASARGTGVYSALSRHVDDALRDRGAIQFGWFHDDWSGVQLRLGWRHVARIEWRRLLLPGVRGAVRGLAARLGRDRGLEASPAAAGELDALWDEIAGRWPLSVRRDAAWFAWRAGDPTRPGEVHVARRGGRPIGAIAFRTEPGRFGRRGVLLDAVFAPGDDVTARILVAHAVRELGRRGALAVSALGVPGSTWDAALASSGLLRTGHGHHLGVLPYRALPDAPPHRWAITGAEGDST